MGKTLGLTFPLLDGALAFILSFIEIAHDIYLTDFRIPLTTAAR